MPTDNEQDNVVSHDFGLPPLTPLASAEDESDSPPPPREPKRRRRAQVQAHDSILDQTEEDERIARMLEDDENAGATVEIGRKTPNNKWAFCCSFPVADWSSESKVQIANEFGGGSYRAVIKRSDKTIASNFTFEIDPSVKPKPVGVQPNFNELIEKLKPAPAPDSSGTMMQMMQAQQAMMMQFMQMQAQQSAENMKALVTLVARPAAASPAGNDRLVEILMTKAFEPRPMMDLPKVIEAVAKLRTVANGGQVDTDDDDDEEKGDDIFGSVVKALPGLIGLIGQGAAQRPAIAQNPRPAPRPRPQAPAPVAPAPAAPAPAEPEPAEEVEVVEEVQINKDVLALFLPQVVELAKQDQTPEQAAEAIREALPGGQIDVLIALLKSDKWLDTLIDAHRPIMSWTRWFSSLRDVLLGTSAPAIQEAPASNP